MSTVVLTRFDEDVRGALTRLIAEKGHAPDIATLAGQLHTEPARVETSLKRLHEAHALLLHPNSTAPWVVHPFALAPGGCWVETESRGYWANCLYCAFGVAAALGCDARITTRLGGESETVVLAISNGELIQQDGVFHLSTPPASWWPHVIYACSSFQPFNAESDVDDWCSRHYLPKGAVITMPAAWRLAKEWYGNYLQHPWRKRTPEEVRALFDRHGLTSSFWKLEAE